MKRIEAFLPVHRLTPVIHQLHELPCFPGLTVLNAHGQGHGRGEGGHYAYDEESLPYHERKLLIVVCEDADAEAIARLIANAAHTGNRGDGIVVISEVAVLLRIRQASGPPLGGAPGSSALQGARRRPGRLFKRGAGS